MTRPNYTILLVKANSIDRELYHRYLRSNFADNTYDLLEVDSIKAGLERCRSHSIDAILLEYGLPDGDGLQFLEWLRAEHNGNHPPVIVVTDAGDETVAVRAMKLGAADYLVQRLVTPELLQMSVQSAILQSRTAAIERAQQQQAQQQQAQQQVQQQTEITKQLETTQRLNRELSDRITELQTLIDILPVGIAIATDPSCAQMQHNACLRQWLGVNPGRNISKSAPAEEQPPFQVFQNGQEVLPEELPMQVAARLGIDIRDAEIEIRQPDGTVRQLLSYATPLRVDRQDTTADTTEETSAGTHHSKDTALGEIRGVVGAFLDITERNRIAAGLRHREALLNLFVKHVPAGVAMLDQEMRYILVSDRWLDNYGLTGQNIVGRSHYEIFPEVPERWKAVHQRCLAGAIESCDEDLFLRADGSIEWIRWEIHPWRTTPDEIGGIIIFSELITERKQVEVQLQQQQATIQRQFAELEGIYATAPVGLCFQNPELRYVRVNDRMAEINGVSAIEHLGRTAAEILPDLADRIEPLHQQVLQTGVPILDVEIHGATKAQPGVDRDWLASYYPLKDAAGQVLGVNVMVQEITDRKQAEAEREYLLQQLENERSFLEQTLQQMPSGVIIAAAPTGKLLFHNEEAFRLFRHPAPTAETSAEYNQYGGIHANGQPYQPEDYPLARAVRSGEVVQAEEIRYRRGDGTMTTLSVNAAPIFNQQGQQLAAVVTFVDVHHQKQLEQEREHLLAQAQAARAEAEAANRSKDDFVSLVAHELRSPINAILGWASLLQSRPQDPATTQKALATITRNTQAQVQLIEDLLDISRMERGSLRLTMATVDLSAVIEAAVETVRPTAEAKGLRLVVQLQSIAPLTGDAQRLQQVVLNLLTNAIKFTPSGGQVHILLEQQSTQDCIQISDTGKGISPEFLPSIFDRFQQDQQTSTAKQGLGLGLAIVKYIVEHHGGSITAHSDGKDQGATFRVILPIR